MTASLRLISIASACLLWASVPALPVHAQLLPATSAPDQTPAAASSPEAAISAAADAQTDSQIGDRLRAIYRELDRLAPVQVAVDAGVVTLNGTVPQAEDVDRADRIAQRVVGVVAVQNRLSAESGVTEQIAPVKERLITRAKQFVQLLPLLLIALIIIALFWLAGSFLAGRKALWRRLSPNSFLAELMATSARLVIIVAGLVIALDLLGASTLLGAILGSAGVVGLAVGFAVKDTVDNYVSSLMLSIRQPFRANDHVVIGDREGRVIRLTSRATILMTLDGNHLRIPNSTVFMAEILNYTRNPERRFDFVLGVDADDDPGKAMAVGVARLRALRFVLDEPSPGARLEEIGDSNIMLRFLGWIDQEHSDWFKARSAAIRAVMMELEAKGFGLPEPIYRLRFDSGSPLEIARGRKGDAPPPPPPSAAPAAVAAEHGDGDLEDVGADDDIGDKVAAERARGDDEDMLDRQRPIE